MGKYLVCLLFVLLSFDSINSALTPFFRRFNLQIVNQLEFHKKLKVQCETKNFGIPVTYLNISESFQYKFIIIPKLLFRCNLWQGPNYKHHVFFEAFFPSRDFIYGTCTGMHPNVCMWIAKEQGVYVRHGKELSEDFKYGWDTPTKQREFAPVGALTNESEFDSDKILKTN
ncbi:S-protein homolog 9-like [Capsella rubella]|uniref:S-protein homolog 9-like n=1 Tax=Capsella rubella TaxID=81985 RepID=UPI000CD57283|nr:S-protein homolog 9-like [Capsella rubella]